MYKELKTVLGSSLTSIKVLAVISCSIVVTGSAIVRMSLRTSCTPSLTVSPQGKLLPGIRSRKAGLLLERLVCLLYCNTLLSK